MSSPSGTKSRRAVGIVKPALEGAVASLKRSMGQAWATASNTKVPHRPCRRSCREGWASDRWSLGDARPDQNLPGLPGDPFRHWLQARMRTADRERLEQRSCGRTATNNAGRLLLIRKRRRRRRAFTPREPRRPAHRCHKRLGQLGRVQCGRPARGDGRSAIARRSVMHDHEPRMQEHAEQACQGKEPSGHWFCPRFFRSASRQRSCRGSR